jgi:hypothetical protein
MLDRVTYGMAALRRQVVVDRVMVEVDRRALNFERGNANLFEVLGSRKTTSPCTRKG